MSSRKPGQKQIPSKWVLAGILLLTSFAYSTGIDGDILNFDDNQYFEQFPEITNLSWHSVKMYFSKHYVLMYHPLPILSFAVQYAITGLDPTPFHLFNILFHLINVVLVYVLAMAMFNDRKTGWFAALVFGIHPMGTEAVTWISARSSVMYTCFFLASLIYYTRYNKGSKITVSYVLSLCCFALALFSKANALPLPGLLLLIDWYEKRPLSRKLILEKLPFLALSVLFGVIALSDSGTSDNLLKGSTTYTILDGLMMSAYSLSFYLVQYFAPIHLSAIHVYPVGTGLPVLFYLSPVLLIGLGALLWKFKTHRRLVFGVGFFAIVVAVTLQVIPSRLFMMADRYTYLPYAGISMALAHLIWAKKGSQKPLLGYLVGGWILILVVVTYQRNKVWDNTYDLVSDIIKKNESHPYLARAYAIRAGIREKEKNDRSGAVADYNKAIALRPQQGITYFGRGQLLFRMGRYQKAKADFLKSEELSGPNVISSNFLGGCEFNLKNYQAALSHYSRAISLDSNFAEAFKNRGSVYGQLKQFELAEKDLTQSIKLVPNDPNSVKFRALVYLNLNNREKACRDLLRAKLLGAKGVDDLIAKNACENLNP